MKKKNPSTKKATQNKKSNNKKSIKKTAKKVTKKSLAKTQKKTHKKKTPQAVKKSSAKAAPKKLAQALEKKSSHKTAKVIASATQKTPEKTGGAMKYKINDLDVVPTFEIESTSGKKFSLADYQNKTFVLYFYPKDSTPGCTIEGNDFTKLHSQFSNLGIEVFGISRDSLKSHQNFIQKQNYCFDLLSDADEKVCKIFDVIQEKNMYGKMVKGIERSTFVVGHGKILKSWRKVKVDGHAQEVLEFVKTLS